MPRIDQMPEYRAQLGRTTHDLSHKFGFTASVAHLMPVFHDFLNPGETVELGVSYNLRTQPLQSAAMVDINSHVEYFFVPINLLYEPFSAVYYNIDDQFSSNFDHSTIRSELPVMEFDDFVAAVLTHTQVPSDFEYMPARTYRLFDMLGYNVVNFKNGRSPVSPLEPTWNPNVFPYPILAYNCIYQYYYRLDTREKFDQNAFNWDQFYGSNLIDHYAWSESYTQIKYRPKDSDYFTDVKLSPIVDVLNLHQKNTLPVVNDWLSRSESVSGVPVISSGSVGSPGVGNSPSSSVLRNPSTNIQTNVGFNYNYYFTNRSQDTNVVNGHDINTANIRAIFANEKLWSITGRAKKNYDDQTLAHFGYKVPHDPKHEISCFGHDRGQIHIGEVISTADTANAALGEIAGKGYGQLSTKPHKFTAPCHGVVMAIMSFTPVLTYGNTYLKANAVAKREDFYIPEYDHLGMQPMFGYELDPSFISRRTNICGWQYRYEQFKRRYHRVNQAFTGAGSLDSWMLGVKPDPYNNIPNTSYYAPFIHRPGELNQIMLVNYAGSVTAPDAHLYDGDPFVIDSFIHCKKVSTMSDYSLPRLDA